jgi:uncharacterized protein with PQ loop repeat
LDLFSWHFLIFVARLRLGDFFDIFLHSIWIIFWVVVAFVKIIRRRELVNPMFNLLIATVVIGSVSLGIWTIYGYFVLPKMHKNSWAYKIWNGQPPDEGIIQTIGCDHDLHVVPCDRSGLDGSYRVVIAPPIFSLQLGCGACMLMPMTSKDRLW